MLKSLRNSGYSFLTFTFITIYLSLSQVAISQEFKTGGIEVKGKATVSAQPDRFVFTINIKERGKSAVKTKALVDKKSQLIVNMYSSMGIDKEEITSSQIQLHPVYEAPSIHLNNYRVEQRITPTTKVKTHINSNNEQEKQLTFQVSRTVMVAFTDYDKFDMLLDKVVKIGVTEIYPLSMEFVNAEQLYQNALAKAIENATQKAEKIVSELSVSLGEIQAMKEISYNNPGVYRMASEMSANFQSQRGKKEISAQVQLLFAIKPK